MAECHYNFACDTCFDDECPYQDMTEEEKQEFLCDNYTDEGQEYCSEHKFMEE